MSEPEASAPTPQPPLEPSKALEAEKLRSETRVNRADAVLKRLEARLLLSKPRWIELSIPAATVIVSVVGFLGSFVASYVKGWADIELTRQKYDSDLVLKAVTNDPKQSRENLRFLLEAGLIKDSDGRLSKALEDPNLSIRIPSQIGANLQDEFSIDQMVKVVDEIKRTMSVQAEIALRKTAGNEMTAWAGISQSGAYEILYTQAFVDTLRRSSRTNWAAYSLVAHEMGHIVLDHLRGDKERKQVELEADRWSGETLAKLGASLAEALAIQHAPPQPVPPSEPSRAERLAAIESGWRSVASTRGRQ